MKNILAFALVALFALAACTEERIEPVKPVQSKDAKKYLDRLFVGLDSTNVKFKVPVPKREQTPQDSAQEEPQRDTVYITITSYDSIFVDQYVYIHDTVATSQTFYYDTLFIQPGRGYTSIPREVEGITDEFFQEAFNRGYSASGGHIAITIEPIDDVLQAYSFDTYAQTNIVLNANLTIDEMWLPLHRELSRQQLDKEYSQIPTELMYPFTNAETIRKSSPKSLKDTFWNAIK